MFNEMELQVLKYFEIEINKMFEGSTFKDEKDKIKRYRRWYREIRLYQQERDYSVNFYQLKSNIDKKYYPAINKLVEEKYLTTFTGRGGQFYQLGKKGFDYLFLGKEE